MAEGKLLHCGQKLLAWCVSNCLHSERGLITKAAAGTGKIDAAVAMANAVMLMLEAPEPWNVEQMIAFVEPPQALPNTWQPFRRW